MKEQMNFNEIRETLNERISEGTRVIDRFKMQVAETSPAEMASMLSPYMTERTINASKIIYELNLFKVEIDCFEASLMQEPDALKATETALKFQAYFKTRLQTYVEKSREWIYNSAGTSIDPFEISAKKEVVAIINELLK